VLAALLRRMLFATLGLRPLLGLLLL